jgi:hypothetical protein
MISKEQAMTAGVFHENHAPGAKVYAWRRNGRTQTWQTRPAGFRIPVKYGLYSYSQIRETDARNFHTADECPEVTA